uniref:Sushi domain containing 1 n=1 Tax=Myripristis murdjan TaxID=586833 RepID=A0A667W8W6_9TELE
MEKPYKTLTDGSSVLSDMQAAGQILDVCASCHANATCDDKSDGSGKVCNCMYGFVGNGRTFCQDKDECQIGASKICGQHTSCHNTYGSYYCTCLDGYSPSNSMANFIPNDGTHCQDIDECRIPGLCGEGALCRNLEGSFDCSCQVGYQVHNGAEPFHPQKDKASCKEVDCGSPPALPHSHILWNKSSKMGSEVIYQCNSGYHHVGKGNVSVCAPSGRWEEASVLCREILCGSPPVIESTEQVWNGNSAPGSTVLYSCKEGFYDKGGSNLSVCNESGRWTRPTLSCQGNSIFSSFYPEIFINEKCLHWKVMYFGSREYQRSFRDKRTQFLSSKAEQVELCLNLLPVTNYSISITAMSSSFTATITANTSLQGITAEYETPLPVLRLHRSANTQDPISLYQVFVLLVEGMMVFDCTSLRTPDFFSQGELLGQYVTAQVQVTHVGTEMNFTVGDGLYYEGFFNAPLESGRNYYVILRAVSQWRGVGAAILHQWKNNSVSEILSNLRLAVWRSQFLYVSFFI